MIFHQGDLGDSVYVIEEGECEVRREQKGEQEVLATLSRGGYFGEMALLSDRTRNATICARTAMDVLIIPKADFNKLRQSVPAFGDVFSEVAKRRAVTASLHRCMEPSHDREQESAVVSGNFGHPDPLEPCCRRE
jgi:CRP-like cAMP-binding protein